jgi:hypothetical protein
MRRRDEDGDGLDLLLDAICNIFGLFIFVAMLVALIVSVRGTEAMPDEAPPTVLDDPLLASGRVEIESLEARIAEFDLASLEEEDATVEGARAALEAAELELLRREASLDAIRTRLGELDRSKESRAEDRPRLEAEIRRLEEEIASVAANSPVAFRPSWSSGGAAPTCSTTGRCLRRIPARAGRPGTNRRSTGREARR